MISNFLLQRFKSGILKFNEHEFYECHDILEEIWFDIRGKTRTFYQGLIHVTVGYYHITVRKNHNGAISQLTKAINKLQPYCPSFQGVELDNFLHKIRNSIQIITKNKENQISEFDLNLIPKFEFDESKFKDVNSI